MFENLNPFAGVSWSNPTGNAGNQLRDAFMTGKGTPWGAGGEKGYTPPMNAFTPLEHNLFGSSGGNDTFTRAMFTGEYTPWGPSEKKGLSGTAPLNLSTLFPGAKDWQQSVDRGLFSEAPGDFKPETAKAFNPDEYTASDYADTNKAGQEEIARNLARQQNDIQASQQRGGTLKSAQTGFGLADALSGAAQGRQNLASQIGQMQYGDKLGQYNNYLGGVNSRNQAGYNDYSNRMNRYNQDKQALGQTLGAALAFI